MILSGGGFVSRAAQGRPAATGGIDAAAVFPLVIDSGHRYLKQANGTPFLIHGDTPWSIAVQLTTAQIDTYLNAVESQGFNTIMFNMIEHYFSSQSPFYKDVDGNIPFTGMDHDTVDWEAEVEAYWTRVDYIVDEAKARGMLCIAFPAYLGYGGGANDANDQGWDSAVDASTDAKLQAYGTWLAHRYTQGNIVWAMGGDYDAPNPEKQWNIVTGIRSVNSTAVVTYHGARGSSAYSVVSGKTGFNLNNIYTNGVEYTYAATEYARSGPIPFFMIEGYYDGETASAADCRRQAYASILSGACGHLYGSNPIWGFGEPHANGGDGAASALSGISTTVRTQMGYVPALFEAYSWHLLQPKTDTSVISSALGSGTSRVCPARASDGSFGMIWVPASQTVTLVNSAFTPSNIRIRLYDPTAGTYSTHTASTANTGTTSVATGGERIIVVDAA